MTSAPRNIIILLRQSLIFIWLSKTMPILTQFDTFILNRFHVIPTCDYFCRQPYLFVCVKKRCQSLVSNTQYLFSCQERQRRRLPESLTRRQRSTSLTQQRRTPAHRPPLQRNLSLGRVHFAEPKTPVIPKPILIN